MRYSTVFKFIAFVLCAATLLGAVGSATALVCITELGGKSVNEHYVEQLRTQAMNYAQIQGESFCSQELGGATQQIFNLRYPNGWRNWYLDWSRVAYVMYDSEGNPVEEQEMIDKRDVVESFDDIPVTGQYMKLISTTPYEEYYPEATEPVVLEENHIYVMPAQEMTEIGEIHMGYTDGHTEEYHSGEVLGTLWYHGGNTLTFESNEIGNMPAGDGWYPAHIVLRDMGGNVVYDAVSTDCVFVGEEQDGNFYKIHLPAGTVTAAAPAGLTYSEGDYTAYDAIPVQGVTVTSMNVTYANAQGESVGSEGVSSRDLIGTVFHDNQGNAEFHSNDPMSLDIPDGCIITHISFVDAQNNLIFEARCPEGVGSLLNDENGYLVFKGMMPGTEMPEETAPEENTEVEATEAAEALEGLTGFAREKISIYQAPSTEAKVVGTLEAWHQIEVIKQEIFGGENWGLIPGGWIPMDKVLVEEAAADAAAMPRTVENTEEADRNIYAAPGTGSKILGTLEAGQEPEIIKQDTFNGMLWGLTPEGWILLNQAESAQEPEDALTAQTVPEETTDEAESAMETIPQTEPAAQPAARLAGKTSEPAASGVPVMADPTAVTETVDDTQGEPLTTEPAPYPEEQIETVIYYDDNLQQKMVAEYVLEPIPEGYIMEIHLAKGALRSEFGWTLLRVADAFRSILLKVLGFCIAVFVLCVVHLCCTAGRTRRNDEVRAGGLNRIPLDLYLCGSGFAGIGLVALAVEGSQYLARNDEQLAIVLFCACAYCVSLLIVGFFFAFVAQIKTPGGFWWRNSFCGWCIRLTILGCTGIMDLCIKGWLWGKPMVKRFFSWLWRSGKALWCMAKMAAVWLWDTTRHLCIWSGVMLRRGYAWTTGKLAKFFGMLPITWQFLTTGFILVFLLYVMMRTYKVGYILLGFGIFFAVILYAASAFAILLESAKRMSKGDLDTKVDDRVLIGGFKEFAGKLNDLAGVAVIAAQKQLKSERMKTELITNVSHDIKTPLTSIINYVDLLQKPHTQEQQTQYLEVLDRQSQRLKKLIDDLMEMSKASTGNLAVDIERVDAAEAVNQALGEFADKLERAQLLPVFRQPDDQVYMMADGRLVWRVMSNLLGNAVKYALPGTRVYLDLLEMDGKVIISMKNISREELNVNADELMERFVRGDASRNTEGSGLGLNIAQSLMELQHGQLQILVDGDLFKVTLIFPGA